MSDFSGNGHYAQCPLCEGKGQMQSSELLARLSNEELIEVFRKRLAAQCDAPAAAESEFENQVRHGPVAHILWRRSPKE